MSGRQAGGIWRGSAALCLAVLLLSVAKTVAAQDLTPLQSCTLDDMPWIDVDGPDADGVFHSAAGEAFFPAELDRLINGDDHTGGADSKNERYAAAALGPANRWGLHPAWIRQMSGDRHKLLQARILEDGQAIYAPSLSGGACADALRGSEDLASLAERGIWQTRKPDLMYASMALQALEEAAGRYVIVRGRVVSLGKTRSTRYLNFGNYWKKDLTATVKTSDVDVFAAALARFGWQFDDLAGRAVEIRGAVQIWDGPHIELLHPEQLVVLENKRAGRDDQNRK